MSEISFGIKKGLNLGTPFPLAKPADSPKKVSMPPIPDPQITPARSGTILWFSNLASLNASCATIMAYWLNLSSFLDSFLSKKSVG